MYKYSLIVSQYYNSYHLFIVHIKPEFIESARSFVREISQYKRDERDAKRGEYLGDFDPKWCGDESTIRSRYNINDAGDIYFINFSTVTECIARTAEFNEKALNSRTGIKKALLDEAVGTHHDYNKVKEIVEKYFEIA